jgi:hypothetical protein
VIVFPPESELIGKFVFIMNFLPIYLFAARIHSTVFINAL